MEFPVGIKVAARGLVWDVIESEPLGEQHRLRLRCAGGDLAGLEWDLLHPHETVAVVRTEPIPEAAGPLAHWRLRHIAHVLDQRPGPDALLAAAPGRVRIEPYQLVPLMRALELPRPRLLLADGVGLGKTVQAALIAVELIARRRAHRIIVVAPSGPLLVQWDQELRQRFGLRFTTIADAAALRAQQRSLELGANPFDGIALCLTALDFAKQDSVLEALERSAWDLAIIDEAHHCVSAALALDREDTQRRRLAEVLARRTDGLLLLTATPHDGYDPHFASLIALLDPSLVDGRGGLAGQAYRRHVVRRLKSHISDPATGAPLFRERRIRPVPVDTSGIDAAPVRAFHRALAALVIPRLRRVAADPGLADALAFVSLLKRSVSTIHACVQTLRVVADRYADAAGDTVMTKERARALRTYRTRAARFGLLDPADEDDAARLEAEGMAADLHATGAGTLPSAVEVVPDDAPDGTAAALRALIRLGAQAERHDPKLAALLTEIRLIRLAHPRTNVLVYTEYADSQAAALRALRGATGIAGEILAISGRADEQERTRSAERCATEDGIILVSTDSLAEGLNLQERCFHLIHLDLPYNPNRLEQRNGRIDRYGQRHDPEIRYLYLPGTFEERLLLRLIAKYEKARACLDVMPDTLGVTADADALAPGLVAGFAEEAASLFPDAPPPVRTLDRFAEDTDTEAYRALLHEIDRAFEGFEHMAARHGWMASQGLNAGAARVAAADAARRRADGMRAGIDLPDFVRAVAALETDAAAMPPDDPDALRLPAAWAAGLEGLPGYDAAHRILRLTRDPARTRDASGRSLAYLGRAHPVVRRAIARAGRDGDGATDGCVSAARAAPGQPLALLLTYSAEIHDPRGTALRRLVAVLLPETGPAVVSAEPALWLTLAEETRAIPPAGLWRRLFADWVPARRPEADAVAAALAEPLARSFADAQRADAAREAATVDRWMATRAAAICGPPGITADLFGPRPALPPWQAPGAPLDRLAAYATDGGNPAEGRRQASAAVELFRQRECDRRARATLSFPPPRLLGMLMLVPPALCP